MGPSVRDTLQGIGVSAELFSALAVPDLADFTLKIGRFLRHLQHPDRGGDEGGYRATGSALDEVVEAWTAFKKSNVNLDRGVLPHEVELAVLDSQIACGLGLRLETSRKILEFLQSSQKAEERLGVFTSPKAEIVLHDVGRMLKEDNFLSFAHGDSVFTRLKVELDELRKNKAPRGYINMKRVELSHASTRFTKRIFLAEDGSFETEAEDQRSLQYGKSLVGILCISASENAGGATLAFKLKKAGLRKEGQSKDLGDFAMPDPTDSDEGTFETKRISEDAFSKILLGSKFLPCVREPESELDDVFLFSYTRPASANEVGFYTLEGEVLQLAPSEGKTKAAKKRK